MNYRNPEEKKEEENAKSQPNFIHKPYDANVLSERYCKEATRGTHEIIGKLKR